MDEAAKAQLAAAVDLSGTTAKEKALAEGQGSAAKREREDGTLEGGVPIADEEYNPMKPNDYEDILRRRARLRAEEEIRKKQQTEAARAKLGLQPGMEKREPTVAEKLMMKMGYAEGQGLGKDSQGLVNPLVMRKTGTASAVIVEGAAKPSQMLMRLATRVLLLTNLVGPGEVDD